MRLKQIPLEGEYKECIENEHNKKWLEEKNLLPRTFSTVDDPYFKYRNKLAYDFYKEKTNELRKTINDLTLSSNILNIIDTIYKDKIFLYNISPVTLEKYIDINNAIDYNIENEKEYNLKEKIEKLNNHNISEIYNKIMKEDKKNELNIIYPEVFSNPNFEPDYNLSNYLYRNFDIYPSKKNIQEFGWQEFNLFNEIDAMTNLSMGYYNHLKFMRDLIKKYNLNESQCAILLLNIDLLYTMFIEYSINEEYDNILENKNIEKLMTNFILLTNNIKIEDLTAYSLSKLLNNRIFFMDIDSILKSFPNITGNDILNLVICKNNIEKDELYKYLDLLNTCDLEIKNLIFNNISSLFSSTYVFPNIDQDEYEIVNYDDCKSSRLHFKSTDIIEKNFLFFESYDKYFENSLSIEDLNKILKNNNCKDILITMLLFKNSLKYNIPKYEDTRYIEQINDVEAYVDVEGIYALDIYGNEYCVDTVPKAYINETLNRYVTSGNLEYGKNDIQNQKNIFKLIKRLGIEDNEFSLNDFLTILTKYRIDVSIYAYINTMINEYNKSNEKKQVKIKK